MSAAEWPDGAALCQPDDPRLAQVWGQCGGWEQCADGPTFVVIGRCTDDDQCARLASRFGFEVCEVIRFRDAAMQAIAGGMQ